jgi:hypothetical protein
VGEQRFQGELQLVGKTATALEIPFDVEEAFGGRRVPVRGTINGFPFRSTLAPMGGCTYLGVNRKLRDGAAVQAGEVVDVVLERDDEPRVVEAPSDLAAALASDPAADAVWQRLSYTHRREYVEWVEEAKREETRLRRIGRTVELVSDGKPLR